jgi:hypothetical protein
MEKLTELGFIGIADYITVVVDDVLDFLNEYYLPL